MTDKIPVKQRLLDAAAELFYREGVGATGIDAITAHAGVAKMSLYNNFASKADLVHAYIEGRHTEWHELLEERLKTAATPKERVLAVFDSYVDHAACAYEWGFRGCGLLNAAAELPKGDPGRASVAAQKDEVEELFKEHLRDMRPADAATDDIAEHLSFVLEGAMSRAGLDGHDGRLKTARRIAVLMLDDLESQPR
ncbi:AcrR family transcriptional regulator [Mesorhizobium soli]|uniref:TetR/AcrR family transcriptional regulator n=1 Tax=Pseudaminobacter soli (ex Li et al. 2025) TaxID=1295366 RepID=UPI002472F290|nr:TetR/AcrR family transcriptional regulator [Mesorhizobium soli]MDH6230674.1 AcrR family transcriptional regulator [Mesorhizobium soli]